MRMNQEVVEGIGRAVTAWRGEVLDFGDSRLRARLPTEEARDLFIARFPGGVGPVGVLVEKDDKPDGVIFRWRARRG